MCPGCRGRSQALHPKGMDRAPKEIVVTQSFSFNKETSTIRNKSSGYISSLKRKAVPHLLYPRVLPVFLTSYSLLPSLTSFFGPSHRLNFTPNHPRESLRSCQSNWKADLTIPTVLDSHGNQFSPAQPSASPSYHSKTRHTPSSAHIHQMNIPWTETQMIQTQGTTVFTNRKFSYLQIQKSGLAWINSYFMLSTQCLYISNAFPVLLTMRTLTGWRQNYKKKKNPKP